MRHASFQSKVPVWLAVLHDQATGRQDVFVMGTQREAVSREVQRAADAFPLLPDTIITLHSTWIDLTACQAHGVWVETGVDHE